MPIDLATEERSVVYVARKKAKTKGEVKRAELEIRQSSLEKLIECLIMAIAGQWTQTSMRNFDGWMNRNYGKLNFYLTQVMSDRECFNKFLFNIRTLQGSECSHCVRGRNNDPWCTLLQCKA